MTKALPSWYYDLTDTSNAAPVGLQGVESPPGFNGSDKQSKKEGKSRGRNEADTDNLKLKKAWEYALAPAKSLPMNLFVSYMSGNSLQLVPIMMTSMMFFLNPFKQIIATNKQFAPLETKNNTNDIKFTKFVYVMCQLLAVIAGVWKLGQMGLLPNTRSDWLAWEEPSKVDEVSV